MKKKIEKLNKKEKSKEHRRKSRKNWTKEG